LERRPWRDQQVPNPVRWADSIRQLAALDVTRCIEVGAGSVLTGMLRNIDPSITRTKFGALADLAAL
jgi:[acyl-carrier-protein] S-malonyltransferase